MNNVYFGKWDSLVSMWGDFVDYKNKTYNQDTGKWEDNEGYGIPEGINVLFASYGNGSYEGDAVVLFEQGGKLYEVNGSHCPSYGLEGQWQPEECTIETLRKTKKTLSDYYGHTQEAHEALAKLLSETTKPA